MQTLTSLAAHEATALDKYLEPLSAVVVLVVSHDGQLLHVNAGGRRILSSIGRDPQQPGKLQDFFVHPTWSELLGAEVRSGAPIYAGIINVGDHSQQSHSLRGVVYRHEAQLLMVGEYDIAELEKLTAQLIELNEQLATTQRNLARSNRELQDSEARLIALSLSDPLTGLANRRHFMNFIQTALARHERYQEPCAVIMADIDLFKNVNDSFGHAVGDEVLLAFSRLMEGNMRKVDMVARLGGEEFIIGLPNTTEQEAEEKAEQLRIATARLHLDCIQGSITASFGVTGRKATEDANLLIKHADEALYAAKRAGRNCVMVYQARSGGIKP